jgi:tRNA-binding EMAP/Myf-like protein
MKAQVTTIQSITKHPNADRLDVLKVSLIIPFHNSTNINLRFQLVTGKHYKEGDQGIWLLPGAVIPGWLAYDLWLVGKTKASDKDYSFTVKQIPIRGVESCGLWIGKYYQVDTSQESHDHAKELLEHGGTEVVRQGQSWITPSYWNPEWKTGDIVDKELGIK